MTWFGTDAVTWPGDPVTSHLSSCCQKSGKAVSPGGRFICQRQVPEVASTAVRPRPKFSVVSNGIFRPPADMVARTVAPGLGVPGSWKSIRYGSDFQRRVF